MGEKGDNEEKLFGTPESSLEETIIGSVFTFLHELNDGNKWTIPKEEALLQKEKSGKISKEDRPQLLALYESIQGMSNVDFKWSQRSGSMMNTASDLAKAYTLNEKE